MATHFLAAMGALVLALEVYDIFNPNELSRTESPVLLTGLALAASWAVVRSLPRRVEQTYSRPKTTVRVEVGDLFDRETNLVIGVADTFDTAVPDIISTGSVQGQFQQKIFNSDIARLDEAIDGALTGVRSTGTVSKPGKGERYPLGTIATLRQPRRLFFLAAYTAMSEKNEARGTVSSVIGCLLALWDEVRAQSNGGPVAIPLIGGGQARMAQVLTPQDSARLIALTYVLASREERVCERLEIVVRAADLDQLDMPELQAFLSSLE